MAKGSTMIHRYKRTSAIGLLVAALVLVIPQAAQATTWSYGGCQITGNPMSGNYQVYTTQACPPGVSLYKASEMWRVGSNGSQVRYAGAATYDTYAYSPYSTAGYYLSGGSYFGGYWHII